jgi:hypothetical protein
MRCVIIRDDDTNALTPPRCLEQLYRPFLDRGIPVNLAVIPEVAVNTLTADGAPEGYLLYRNGEPADRLPIGSNPKLIAYLRDNRAYQIAQHGCFHDWLEFDQLDRVTASNRIDRGARTLQDAGFSRPRTFVAPYDKLSRGSLAAVAARFDVLSTGWFEARRLPQSWWPRFAFKKLRNADHWRVGNTCLLSHPGCLLSCNMPRHEILPAIIRRVEANPLTVLVTHWWEYFRAGKPDEPFIEVLHKTADYLASSSDIKTLAFDDIPDLGRSLIDKVKRV